MSERTQVCGGCRQRKYLRDYYFITDRKRHSTICKTCTLAQRRAAAASRRHYCTSCGARIRRSTLCNACRQAKREQVEKTLAPVPLSPGVCGLPIRGGRCLRAVDDGTDSNGRATLFCSLHGERYAPVIRPPNFVRYDQRLRHDEGVDSYIKQAKAKVDPAYAERNALNGRRGRNKEMVVFGRDLSRKIHAA